MPRTYKPDPRKKKTRNIYSQEEIDRAIEDKVKNNLSFRAAAKKNNIDYTVLCRYARGNVKKCGGQTALSSDVEKQIVENINICADWGYPMDQRDLRMLVKIYLDKKGINSTKFKNNFPGVDFAYGFLKRHNNSISERYRQNIKLVGALVSADVINNYFDNLEITLAGVPAANIINYDETNLTNDPGRKKVIARRGSKYPERVMNQSKSSISLMLAGTASGQLFPPYIIYRSQHLYDLWMTGGPKGSRYNRTASGWMDIITFEDWISTILIPYAKRTPGKLYVIGDNLSCHLSIDAINICNESDVHLIFLPANSKNLTQPLDVAFFQTLKVAWSEILTAWKNKEGRNESSLPKSIFPQLLSKLYAKIQTSAQQNLILGFKKTGIFPLNRQEVLNRLPREAQEPNAEDANIVNDSVVTLLKSFRYSEETARASKQKKKKLNDIEEDVSSSD